MKDDFRNVGGIDADDKIVQGIVAFLESGQIVITSVNTDDERSVTFALADPLNVNVVSPVDDLNGAVSVIPYEHKEIHSKDSFHVDTTDTSMANNDTLVVAFKTPAGTKRGHMVIGFHSKGMANIQMLEGPTWDNESGSLLPIYNRFREDAPDSSVLLEDAGQASFTATNNLILNPASLAGGAALDTLYTFASRNRETGGSRGIHEWVLEPDEQYAIVLTANEASNAGQLIVDWYEHTDA